MKIIGENTQKYEHKFILEANEEELKQLLGFAYRGDGPQLKPGMEINVHAMFNRLYGLKNKENELKRAANSLRSVAELLDVLDPVVQTAGIEEVEKANER
jgi:hypothetical protein